MIHDDLLAVQCTQDTSRVTAGNMQVAGSVSGGVEGCHERVVGCSRA
jgi:hypothetical protein